MIRLATVDDLDCLMYIEENSFKHGAWSRSHFRVLIKHGKGKFWVFEDDFYLGNPLSGYIYVSPQGRIISIAALEQCGIGTMLLKHAEQFYKKLHLEVCESNARAISFYEYHGYVQYGRCEKYYDNGESALLFKKDLSIVQPSNPV